MPVPVVAVEVAPPVSKDALTMLTDTCSLALSGGRCAPSGAEGTEAEPVAIAIVSWTGADHRHARVQVGVRGQSEAQWRTREVFFQAADPELERWRSLGLTIAIVIGELPETRALLAPAAEKDASDGPPPGSNAVPIAPATPASGVRPDDTPRNPALPRETPVRAEKAPPSSNVAGAPRPRGFVSAQVLAGPGLDRGPWRRGAAVTAARTFAPLPMALVLGVAYAWRPRESSLDAHWLTLSAGVGRAWPLAASRVALWTRAYVSAEELSVTALHAVTGREDSSERWAPHVGVGLGPILELWRPFSLACEVQLDKPLRNFTIYNNGSVTAHTLKWGTVIQVGPLLTFD